MYKKSPKRIPEEYKKAGLDTGDILLGKIIECIDGERCKLVETWSRAHESGGDITRREFGKVDIKELGDNDEKNIEYMKSQSRLWGIPSAVDIMEGGGRVFISKKGDVESMMVYKDRGHLCKTKIKIRIRNHVLCIPDTEIEKHKASRKDTLNYIVSHPITKAVIRSMFEIYNVPEDVYVVAFSSDLKYDSPYPPGGYYAMNEMTVNIVINGIFSSTLQSEKPGDLNVGMIIETVVHECVHLAESQSGLTYSGYWAYRGGVPRGFGSEMVAKEISKEIVDYLWKYDKENVIEVILNTISKNVKTFVSNYHAPIRMILENLSTYGLIFGLAGVFIERPGHNISGPHLSETIAVSFLYYKARVDRLNEVLSKLLEEGFIINYELREMGHGTLEPDSVDEDLGKLFIWIDVEENDYRDMLKGVYFDDY